MINDIEVLPLSPMDKSDPSRILSGHLRRSCPVGPLWFSGGAFYLHIVVKSGNVVLEGVVANAMDKNIAGLRANGVSGVFSVTNDLVAESELPKLPHRN